MKLHFRYRHFSVGSILVTYAIGEALLFGATSADTACADFKHFIAFKPKAVEFLYERSEPPLRLDIRKLPGRLVNVTNVSFECQWQADAYHVKQTGAAAEGGEVLPPSSFYEYGLFHGSNWEYAQSTIRILDSIARRNNEPPPTAELNHESILTIINLGIGPLSPDTVKWSGNTFRSKTLAGDSFDGQIDSLIDSKPSSLVVTNLRTGSLKYIHYEYNNVISPQVPDAFTVEYKTPEGKSSSSYQYRITKWQINNASLDETALNPAATHPESPLWRYAGNQLLAAQTNGSWKQIGTIQNRPRTRSLNPALGIAAITLLLTLPLVLAIRRTNIQKRQVSRKET